MTSAIVLLSVFLFLFFFAGFLRTEIFSFFDVTFTKYMLIETLTIDTSMEIYKDLLMEMAFILLPIMLVAVVAGIAANFFQFGLLFTTEPFKFDLKKIDPIKGLKRIFSIKSNY